MNHPSPAAKLLIQAYKHIDEARNLLEEVINQMGQHQIAMSSLPEDIQHLVHVALQLSPEQRKTLQRFLESLKDSH
ncbi:hypothetical protein JQC72_04135 [Polycladomyces sp. WAk]|uniref:Uncharacterized protein n=1 Tax=Polycladomyces zharkentensis TaxID=2807616 RepID=A0ABS2WGR2_9BACL|nr:hypothetical protein [Polycladomyces sp. WAk]MBN2908709.1 hypothetical protein [Polycladomyces sp. WAk]